MTDEQIVAACRANLPKKSAIDGPVGSVLSVILPLVLPLALDTAKQLLGQCGREKSEGAMAAMTNPALLRLKRKIKAEQGPKIRQFAMADLRHRGLKPREQLRVLADVVDAAVDNAIGSLCRCSDAATAPQRKAFLDRCCP